MVTGPQGSLVSKLIENASCDFERAAFHQLASQMYRMLLRSIPLDVVRSNVHDNSLILRNYHIIDSDIASHSIRLKRLYYALHNSKISLDYLFGKLANDCKAFAACSYQKLLDKSIHDIQCIAKIFYEAHSPNARPNLH